MRRAWENLRPLLFALVIAGAGYAAAWHDLKEREGKAYASGYEAGFAKAAERWPIRRALYRSEADYREVLREWQAERR